MDAWTKMIETRDPIIMLMQQVLSCQPEPPIDSAAPLSNAVAASAPADGIDRIGRLPVEILRNIVSRLPAKDGARTTVLSKRWRRMWRTVPLALIDAHVLPVPEIVACGVLPRGSTAAADSRGHTDSVSDALAAHPGPFRCVHLTRVNMDIGKHQAELASWLELLGAKGVHELVLVNRTRNKDTDAPLPATLFRCASLAKLYLSFWWFPDTTTLQRNAAFPYLQEVGLCSLVMKARDLDFLQERCPVLEKLLILRSRGPVCLRIQSHSLRCVQVCSSVVQEISVVHASHLERLLLCDAAADGSLAKVKIGHAPKLRFLGLFVPEKHQLEIGSTIIKAGAKAGPNAIVPSVQMLAIQVKLGTRVEARMLPGLFRCFPNVKTLYIQSENDDIKSWGPQSVGTGKVNLKFWEEAGPTECIQRHMKKVVLRDFRGKRSELDFLSFIAGRAQVLEKMEIMLTQGNSPSDRVDSKLRTHMASAKWSNGCCELMISQNQADEYQKGTPWCYRRAFDLSNQDPFDISKCVDGKCLSH
ncbi:hypothetical protein QOZ80_2AG0130050 [Eleusine coracana subsp. coracana]|nr:hypothetical protein QOZ80_2AG0130050 [Eleusine coracana subsp. coracana]